MKRSATIVLFSFLCTFAWSQNFSRIKELKSKVKTAKNATQFGLLNDLAWEYRFALPDSTIYFAEQAILAGEASQLMLGMAKPLNFIGVAYLYKGDKLTAYQYYTRAFEKATEQIDTLQIAFSKNNLGRLFYDQGLLARSYPYFVEALQLFESIGDSSGTAYAYQSLASLYRTQKDFEKAELNFTKALNIRLLLKNTRDIQSAYSYLGRLYQESGDISKSNIYFLKSDSASIVINDEINIAELKTRLAENYLLQNNLSKAEDEFKKGFTVISRANNVRHFPRCYNLYGKILLKKGENIKAKEQFIKALEWSIKIKELESQMEAYLNLSNVAKLLKNKQEELANYNNYLVIKDSLSDLDVARKVERLQFEIRIEQEERENDSLKLEKAEAEATILQQRLQNITLIAVALSLLIVGILISLISRKRREANTRLAHQNKEIEQQRVEIMKQNEVLSRQNHQLSDLNHEKDTLMSIVAHDLKSPLNRIRGLVEVMRLEGGLEEEKLKLLKMIEDSTQGGLFLITDLLDVHEIEENRHVSKTSIDIGSFFRKHLEDHRAVAVAKGINIRIEESPLRFIHSDVEYLNRILDNLITNAIKFSKRGSTITIRSGTENNQSWISVKDEGPGFQELDKKFIYQKFKRLSARPTGGESSNGLGLAIVKTLVDRLQGEITLNTEIGKGSEFIVKLPAS